MSNASDFVIENGILKKYKGSGGDVVIPDGVTSIGDWAFKDCRSLTNITIPDGVTSIGYYAFLGCIRLTSITIPGSVASIGNGAFQNCHRLTSITIPDSVTSIGWNAFRDCRSLTSITIPGSVTSIGAYAFMGTAYYKAASNWENGVLYIGQHLIHAYHRATKTEHYIIKAGTRTIGDLALFICDSLKSITIPDSVTSIGKEAFHGCSSLKSITIPDSVTSIGKEAFSDCTRLTSITWPSALAAELNRCLPWTWEKIILHIADLSNVNSKFRPNAAVGFAEDDRDCTDENGKKYLKYIKSNAARLAGLAVEHPALLYLMLREKLIAAKDLEAVTTVVQESGSTELIAAMLDYGNSAVSEKDKAKVQQKKEERETNVTNFIFDAAKVEVLIGKTFVVTGKLKTFVSHDELEECLTTCDAVLTDTLAAGVDYLITNAPDSGTAKNKKAVELGIERITEAQFNEMIGRTVQ